MKVKAVWTVGFKGKRYGPGEVFACGQVWGEKKRLEGKVEILERENKPNSEEKFELEKLNSDELYSLAQKLEIKGRSKIKNDRKALLSAIKEMM